MATATDQNKVKYGLNNVHYAVITETIEDGEATITYDTPTRIRGAVNLTLSPAGEVVEFAADDDANYYEENTNNGYEGSLEIALIPDSFKVDVLGFFVDDNGAIVENRDAKAKRFALLYQFDGDANKTRYVDYNCLAARPDVTGATTTKTKEPQPETMNITSRPASDTGDVRSKITQNMDPYDDFFSAVYLKQVTPEG